MVGTVLTTKTMMKTQIMAVCVHWKTPLKSVMIFTLCGATAIPRTIPTTPRSKILGFFIFPFKKHLTSAPGCGIIIVGRAGPGRRPGTEFPIGPPICNFFGGKCSPSICHQFPGNPASPIGSHIWPHCGPKIGFDLPREQIKTPLNMPLACL